MSELTPLRQVQLAELELAKKFVNFCDEHDLRYFMLGGTFLGAIRHRGFIPWDDDMDFAMSRDDYKRFISLYQKQPCDFELITVNDRPPYRICARVLDSSIKIKIHFASKIVPSSPPWIDIFPLDNLPNNKILRNIWKYYLLWRRATVRYALFSKCSTLDRPGRPLIERVLIKMGRILPVEYFFHIDMEMKKLDKAAQRFTNIQSNYLINVDGTYKQKEIFQKEVFGVGALYEFEGLRLRGPSDYHTYLTQLYGDYMTPPPKESEEKNHHNFTTIEIEK